MQPSASQTDSGRRDLTREIAEAYRSAALRQADMVQAVRALETIRAAFSDRETGLRGLNALDDQIGLAENVALRDVLVELRATIFALIRDEQIVRLRARIDADRATGSADWLQAYAAALSFWRLDLCRAFCAPSFELDSGLPPITQFARWTRLMLQDRWAEVEEVFLLLIDQESIKLEQRAQFLVNAAQISLYALLDTNGALAYLNSANEIAPENPVVICGFGEYHLAANALEEARERFESARSADPQSDAWYLLGDICEREGKIDEAESWYREALARTPASDAAYTRLVRLYTRAEGPSPDETRVEALLERAAIAKPTAAYGCYVAYADALELAGKSESAHVWYEKAIDLDPDGLGAYAAKGYACMNAGGYDDAERAFAKAIEVAPEALDGHWGMGWLYEQTHRFDAALAQYTEALSRRPSWEAQINTRIGAACRSLGRYDEAEEALMHAFRRSPDDENVLAELHQLSTDLYMVSVSRDSATRILEQIHAVKGTAYDSEFHNRTGNLDFWFGEFEPAEQAYRRALESDPENGVIHRNLSAVLRELGDFDGARAELKRAFELDPDEDADANGRGLLLNAEGNALFEEGDYEAASECYERATALIPDNPVIFANLALSWTSLRQSERRSEALEQALAALRTALELEPANETYRASLESYEFEQRLCRQYGAGPGFDGERVIGLSLASDLADEVIVEGTTDLAPRTLELIGELRERLRIRCGLAAPPLRFSDEESLPAGSYGIDLVGNFVASGQTVAGARLYIGAVEQLERLGLSGQEVLRPDTGTRAWWLDDAAWPKAEAAGLELWDRVEYPLRHLESVVVGTVGMTVPAAPEPAAR